MGKIYKNQTKMTLSVTVSTNITGGTATLKYIKPDNAVGEFTGVTITDYSTGIMTYVPSATDFDQVGEWTIWSYVIFSDNKVAAGEPFKLTVYKEGT